MCNERLLLKVQLGEELWACCIYNPPALEVNDLVTLDCHHCYVIIRISKKEVTYKIALKGYREISLNSLDEIAVIKGVWLSKYDMIL